MGTLSAHVDMSSSIRSRVLSVVDFNVDDQDVTTSETVRVQGCEEPDSRDEEPLCFRVFWTRGQK